MSYAAIGLHQPKTPANVGHVLRAAGCFGASMVVTTGQRYTKAPTDPQRFHKQVPLLRADDLREAVPFDCVPVLVELLDVATSLHGYTHPKQAFYMFGPEDGTFRAEWARDVVYIPSAACLNLAMAVSVVLYDRFAKECVATGRQP